MESAQFSRLEENFRPVGRFWDFWPSKIRFGQNVLRMTWKERFVQFSWKAHCFPGLKRIWGQCDDFENFDAHKRDLAKTCCAWPEKNVFTIFTKSAQFLPFEENLRQVWRFWKLWRSLMRFGQNVLLWKAHCFPGLKRTWGQCYDFENFDAQKCDLAKTCCAWPEKSVLYNFHGKRTVFLVWREFEASVTILRTLTLTNAIWPKRAAHDLKTTFLQFLWKAHSFSLLKRIWDKCDDFENFDAHKCDLAKTCCAWPKKSVL